MSEKEAVQNAKTEEAQERAENTVEVEEIEANAAEDVKGGPKRIFIGGLS